MSETENRRFLRRVFTLMIPVLIQNGITNFVSMLDNVMVGRVGKPETSAVSIAGLLIFIFNLCIFGAVSGAGIFGAQFFGAGDTEGLRRTFRFKIVMSAVLTAAATATPRAQAVASPLQAAPSAGCCLRSRAKPGRNTA